MHDYFLPSANTTWYLLIMQCFDPSPSPEAVEMRCTSDCDFEDAEQLIVIELVIPLAAVVPAALCYSNAALPVVRAASVTSTVPATVFTQLRANNTALSASWRTTATLSAPQAPRHLSVY